MESIKEEVIKEAKRIKEDAQITFKAQYEDAARWRLWHNLLVGGAAIFAGAAGFTALKEFEWGRNAIIFSSFFSALFSIILSVMKPLERMNEHYKAGALYQALRDEVRIFENIQLIRKGVNEKELIQKIQLLSNKLSELRMKCPQHSGWAYKKARKGIEEGEAEYKVDSENV